MNNHLERRRFTRIPFDAECELHSDKGSAVVQLLDISLRGTLIESPRPLPIEVGETARLHLYLANDILIEIPATLKHAAPPQYGFVAEGIEIDSITHLRRLIELNLGDETLLERELEQLLEG
ncbi:PilZ domain-containing protein [Marinobacterium sediminicola]|uniref:Cyclic diguanosine monophosphate-binding protein n=1 Tax=Marinobacterium sediminicola TaxID=518898 RepID=A0ABY1S2F2_9GAMM|nr:PilZ domain-containing protein [Marinobacterium sediminicola]ULG69542.1 PilZ domain-containing protein [Marinobacterium sediminicola]SMR75695.1 PilZ domain-containing protein [Marinobacterium sediminicola]